jgi:hypothetical protein
MHALCALEKEEMVADSEVIQCVEIGERGGEQLQGEETTEVESRSRRCQRRA